MLVHQALVEVVVEDQWVEVQRNLKKVLYIFLFSYWKFFLTEIQQP